ncbi:MAG: TIGR03790 family protein [Armatimonadetes bacterium]|nr:TIGR03790 family protein [Armatimonadota bacterium]MBS1727284.1 TIGR03790 family protein [Armatimonadota bacterium]
MVLAFLLGCSNSTSTAAATIPQTTGPSVGDAARVLVVMNESDNDSIRIAGYYLKKRGISRDQLVGIKTSTTDNISPDRYKSEIETPIRAALAKNPKIDFIVLTKGIPLRLVDEGGYSVDATLASMELNFAPIGQTPGKFGITEANAEDAIKRCRNPYFAAKEPFSHKRYGMYLVTRLIGYSVEDCLKLVDNSVAAKPSKAPILLDSQPKFQPGSGYWPLEESMLHANEVLSVKNIAVDYDKTETFSDDGGTPLAGYASWGSNDKNYDPVAYHNLKFVPGAIAETFVSTSARTFTPTKGGQSLIADLVQQGVTGVKGYVSEPFTFALCRTEILFDRYESGFNLAESFYAASPIVKWKDIVVGDPLCRPYKK